MCSISMHISEIPICVYASNERVPIHGAVRARGGSIACCFVFSFSYTVCVTGTRRVRSQRPSCHS